MRERSVSILMKCTGLDCGEVLIDQTVETESREDEPSWVGPWVEVRNQDYSLCTKCFHKFYASLDAALIGIGVDTDAEGTLSIRFKPATGARVL